MSEGDTQPSAAPVVAEAHQVETYPVPQAMFKKHPKGASHLKDIDAYKELYEESIK